MADASTGAGEPSRTLALLWRDARGSDGPGGERRRGPGRSVTVDAVVDAGLTLADAEGLAAVTMRGVAQRVGVSTMSVYTYVPGKAELLDLMVDLLYLRMPRRPWRIRTWRRRLERVAETNRALFAEHPWLTEVAVLSRPPLGPGLMAKYEHELAALDGTGLDDVTADAVLAHLLAFVQGHARAAHDAARTTRDTAMSDAAWWAANQPLLERVLDPASYPRAVRIGAAAGEAHGSSWSAQHAWRFGLARTLDGLGALIEH
ncbi:MAG TPA: TetR/AcrR family transcriptional regulator [Intrasporangium sp.]|uniref:TetR/AcrR family transcriptional regulator n=1 Tax=Intrasporangium sp. TaxID=1925024 RepID=UPI002F9551C4